MNIKPKLNRKKNLQRWNDFKGWIDLLFWTKFVDLTFEVELKSGLAKTGPIFGVEDIVCDEFDFLFVVEGRVGVMIDLRVFKLDFTFGCELIAPKK